MRWLITGSIGALLAGLLSIVSDDIRDWLPRAGVKLARLAERIVPENQRAFYAFASDVDEWRKDAQRGLRSHVLVFLYGLKYLTWTGPIVRLQERGIRSYVLRASRLAVLTLFVVGGILSGSMFLSGMTRGVESVSQAQATRATAGEANSTTYVWAMLGESIGVSAADASTNVGKIDRISRELASIADEQEMLGKQMIALSFGSLGFAMCLLLAAGRITRWVLGSTSVVSRRCQQSVLPIGLAAAAQGLAVVVLLRWEISPGTEHYVIAIASGTAFVLALHIARAERRHNRGVALELAQTL